MAARLILNPAAGSGRALAVYDKLKPFINEAHVEVFRTQRPGHATELAREVAQLDDMTVISLGGDGTHHEVINGLLPAGRATFAVIPAGTGNDFARVLHYPPTPVEQLTLALKGPTRKLDIGMVGDQYFLTVSGIGFDAEVANWVNARPKRGNGTWIFVRGVFRHLLFYRAQPLTVALGEARRQELTFMIAVGNTRYYAGGMKICPDADPQDGLFQVVWVEAISPFAVLPLLVRVFGGSHVRHRRVKTFMVPRLAVDAPEHLWVHADGELIGHPPVTFRTVPEAIRVRVGEAL
ncbi:MAG: diacylglycerol kinase family lipid kinase [Thermaerobacter sp.]|nr:diacylglycerol kinase family lipid kinase [Thermaerobacter sp.]